MPSQVCAVGQEICRGDNEIVHPIDTTRQNLKSITFSLWLTRHKTLITIILCKRINTSNKSSIIASIDNYNYANDNVNYNYVNYNVTLQLIIYYHEFDINANPDFGVDTRYIYFRYQYHLKVTEGYLSIFLQILIALLQSLNVWVIFGLVHFF